MISRLEYPPLTSKQTENSERIIWRFVSHCGTTILVNLLTCPEPLPSLCQHDVMKDLQYLLVDRTSLIANYVTWAQRRPAFKYFHPQNIGHGAFFMLHSLQLVPLVFCVFSLRHKFFTNFLRKRNILRKKWRFYQMCVVVSFIRGNYFAQYTDFNPSS